jgi:hypothetical protein
LIDQQRDLDIISIQYSVKDEQLRNQLIQNEYDKALLAKKELEDAKTKAEIDAALQAKQSVLSIQQSEYQEGLEFNRLFWSCKKKTG